MNVLFGLPTGPEIVIIALLLLIPVALAYWVYTDAERRGNENAALWAVIVSGLFLASIVGGILALGVYIWQR